MAALVDRHTPPESLARIQLHQWKHMLHITVSTGLKHSRRNPKAEINRWFGTNFRFNKQALEFVEMLLQWDAWWLREVELQVD